jgi:hypothetical protein
LRRLLTLLLAHQLVIVGMRADPEPDHIFPMLDGQGAIVQPDPDGPEAADLLEV